MFGTSPGHLLACAKAGTCIPAREYPTCHALRTVGSTGSTAARVRRYTGCSATSGGRSRSSSISGGTDVVDGVRRQLPDHPGRRR